MVAKVISGNKARLDSALAFVFRVRVSGRASNPTHARQLPSLAESTRRRESYGVAAETDY